MIYFGQKKGKPLRLFISQIVSCYALIFSFVCAPVNASEITYSQVNEAFKTFTSPQRKQLQSDLRKCGYTSTIDGLFGKNTYAAIKRCLNFDRKQLSEISILRIFLNELDNYWKNIDPTDSKSHFANYEPTFSKFFYGDQLGAQGCFKGGMSDSRVFRHTEMGLNVIPTVVGFDWWAHHKKTSNSININSDPIGMPARYLFTLSHSAVSMESDELKTAAIKLILDIAEADTLLNTPTLQETLNNNTCYGKGGGDGSAFCGSHAPAFTAQFAGNYFAAASLIAPFMDEAEKTQLLAYSKKLFDKYVQPIAEHGYRMRHGFSQMGQGSLSVLYYAYLTVNHDLAATEFNKVFKTLDASFLEDGYIWMYSFRGVRGYWYHTYGVNSALAVIHIANSWKVPVPKNIIEKVTKSAELINVGIDSLDEFYSRKSPSNEKLHGAVYAKGLAINNVHQHALAIDELAQMIVGVDLKTEEDHMYLSKREWSMPNDWTIGFHPLCAIPAKELD